MSRSARVERNTGETSVLVELDLDQFSRPEITVPDGFLGHMLDALCRHSGLGVTIVAEGDIEIDLHHTVEDVGITLGDAVHEALAERRGIERFGSAFAPLDEALARAVVDLSGRGFFVLEMDRSLERSWVTQSFPLTLVGDFFQAFADRARINLHLDVLRGRNPHHVAEASFKAVAVALRCAVALRPGNEVPSTKGTLTV